MSVPHATDGIVLRAVDYSETSQVVTFWTRDAGRLAGIAKGAKRAKTVFRGPFDLFGLHRIVYREKPAGQLHLLTSADLLDAHAGLRADPARLTAASYCAEILLGLTADGMPHRPLFELLADTLRGMAGAGPAAPEAGRPAWEGRLYRFEAQALTHLGHRPRATACAVCGAALPAASLVRFSARAGGAVCDPCAGEEPAPLRVRPETLRALASLGEPGAPPPDPPLPPPIRQELRALLRSAYTYLLERPPAALGLLP